MQTEEKPAVFKTLDDLQSDVTSAEDQAVLDEWNREAQEERKAAVAHIADRALPELVQLGDGSVVTKEERDESLQNDEEGSGPYDGHGRA